LAASAAPTLMTATASAIECCFVMKGITGPLFNHSTRGTPSVNVISFSA
jgi:hypothetical protein